MSVLRGPELGVPASRWGSSHSDSSYDKIRTPLGTCTHVHRHTDTYIQVRNSRSHHMKDGLLKGLSKFAIRGSSLVSPENKQRANEEQLQNSGSSLYWSEYV